MSEHLSQFVEIVHIDRASVATGEGLVEQNIRRLISAGIEVHFVSPDVDLAVPVYTAMPDKDVSIVLGGKYFSNGPTMHGHDCVDRRAAAWKTLGYCVIINPEITMTDAEAQWTRSDQEFSD